MKITNCVFTCDVCGAVLEVPPQKTGIGFIRIYRKFRRKHDLGCLQTKNVNDKVERQKQAVNSYIDLIMKKGN